MFKKQKKLKLLAKSMLVFLVGIGLYGISEAAFTNGFEEATIAAGWGTQNATNVVAPNTFTIETTAPNSGTQCSKLHAAVTAAKCRIAKNITMGSECYLRLYFKLDSGLTMSEGGDATLLIIQNTDSQESNYVQIHYAGGTFSVFSNIPTDSGEWVKLPSDKVSGTTVTKGVWHWLEVHYKIAASASSADGLVELWLDGTTKVGELSGVQNYAPETHTMDLKYLFLGNAVAGGLSGDIYFDDVSVQPSGPIGPLGGNPTLSTAVSPTGAGTVTLNPTGGSYTAGTTVTVTAAANSGYTFTSWTGGTTGTSNPVVVTVNSNMSVTATFSGGTVTSYTLTTAVSPTGGGTVALSPTGPSYTPNTTVTVTATPATDYSFTSWTGAVTGTNASTTVTMDAAKSVTATFTYSGTGTTSYALTTVVSPTGGGTVDLSPAGGNYAAGTTVTLTATPASGYMFSAWSGAVSGASSPATVTMDTDKSVTATFTAIGTGYTLTAVVTPTGGGTITLSPTGGVYASGTAVTVTATAASGYNFSGWLGSVSGTANTVIVIVDSNKTVTASFSAVNSSLATAAIKAYNNPFDASGNGKLKFYGKNVGTSEIKIYSSKGELIRTLTGTGSTSNEIAWDGTNDGGEKVASGVYFYAVKGGGKGRICLVR